MKLKVAGKILKSHWKQAYDEAVKQEEMISLYCHPSLRLYFLRKSEKNGDLQIHGE